MLPQEIQGLVKTLPAESQPISDGSVDIYESKIQNQEEKEQGREQEDKKVMMALR